MFGNYMSSLQVIFPFLNCRLQVLCHEHNPDEKKAPRDDEVCGYPIENKMTLWANLVLMSFADRPNGLVSLIIHGKSCAEPN